MKLWSIWWDLVKKFRPAFSRQRTFLWFAACLAAMMIREDNAGVTSFVRTLGIVGFYYDRMLDFFHSPAINLKIMVRIWVKQVVESDFCYKINGRILLICDGIKTPKEGKKMPAVKSLHQESDSNHKPEYIMGHSCQVIAVLCQALSGFFAIPLIARIHEGIKFSNRDKRTLIDKMNEMMEGLHVGVSAYLLADAYYACKKTARFLLGCGNHLISLWCETHFAPETCPERSEGSQTFQPLSERSFRASPFRIRPWCFSHQGLVKFVLVNHPLHGKTIYMSTDISLDPIQIITAYGLRFKIEFSFKQAINVIGTYAYHFWMKTMKPIKRGSGNQYLHRKSEKYRNMVRRKMNAYHLHLQLGVIAQGILNIISITANETVWYFFRSWLRTIRPGIAPSELVTQKAMRGVFFEFLLSSGEWAAFAKFILKKVDPRQNKVLRLGSG